jgi:23S rRNA U2552 (ribose-2'-O)-methylase RlmE/FtsJ
MGELKKYFDNNVKKTIHKWQSYFEIYEKYFSKYKDKPINLLEIGVNQGGSLQMWSNYFSEDSKIYGIDIDPKYQYEEKNIKVFIGSQSDKNFLNNIGQSCGPFDIIIDDGGHQMDQQIISLQELYPYLSDNGLYLCEDTHSSYLSVFQSYYRNPNSFIEHSKGLVDQVNKRCNNKEIPENAIFSKDLFAVHFHEDIVVFEKRKKINNRIPKKSGFKVVIDEWFEKSNFKEKSLSPISPDTLNHLLKKYNLYKKFPPDLAIYNISDQKAVCINKEDVVLKDQRAVVYENYITYLIEKYNIKFQNNSHFIFDLASACPNRNIYQEINNVMLSSHVPNKENLHCLPFTDCHYIHPHYAKYYKSQMEYSDKSFSNKINKLIWRGNSYPTLRPEENMYDPEKYQISGNKEWCNLRLDLCKKYFNNPNMDLGFHETTDAEWKKPYREFLRDKMNPKEISDYKYILDVCGSGATCEATIWKLQSGSLLIWLVDDIFYKKNQPLWCAWYTPLLKPFEHYVPANLENLEETFYWCENHQKECLAISNNAQKIIRDILEIWEEANAYILQKISTLNA